MFNIFNSEPTDTSTTYFDVSTQQLKTVPNIEYNRKQSQVIAELYPFSTTILKPTLVKGRLEFETVHPHDGQKVWHKCNLEALLANLALFRSFIVNQVPALTTLAYKPQQVSQEAKLREAGLKMRNQLQELTQQLEEATELNQQLNQRVAELESMIGDGWQDIKLIITKLAEVNIQVQFLESYSDNDIHTYVFKNVGLSVDQPKLKRVADSMPALLVWVTKPPSFEVSRGEIVFEFDTRDIETQLDSVQQEWLPTIVGSDTNLMVFGARGSGKTSLVNNYIYLTIAEHPESDIEYLQPKAESDTPIDLVPTALGFEDCFARHQQLISEYEARNKKNNECLKQGLDLPVFRPKFIIYEELQAMVAKSENAKQLCKDIETMVSFGRTLGFMVLATAQVANLRNFPGWSRASLTQYNRLYIGEAINTAIDQAPTAATKKSIREQYSLYRSSKRKYYGLLQRPTGESFIYDLPKPLLYHCDTPSSDRFIIKCLRRNYQIPAVLNQHLTDMVRGDTVVCPNCDGDLWIPSQYKALPGSTVPIRCYTKHCKTKTQLKL